MIKAVVFDLDGVIYRGDTLIPGAKEAVLQLRKKGFRVYFLTNANTHSRKARAQKLIDLGIETNHTEVFTSSHGAAKYIESNYPVSKRNVFVISGYGVEEELLRHNARVVSWDKANIVVVGLDIHVNYEKLSQGFKAIYKGADFIATNCDATYPVEDGLLPGAGAIVKFLEYSSGKKPITIGKPNHFIMDILLEETGLKKSEVIIVGDRLESDILLGKNTGIKTVLVLSGVTKKEDLKKLKKNEKPDYVIKDVSELNHLLNRV